MTVPALAARDPTVASEATVEARGVLNAAPLHAWLADYLESFATPTAAATSLGITQARLTELRAARTVTVGVADRLFVAACDPGALARLYPLDVNLDAAWCPACCEEVGVFGDHGQCVWCDSHTEIRSAVAA